MFVTGTSVNWITQAVAVGDTGVADGSKVEVGGGVPTVGTVVPVIPAVGVLEESGVEVRVAVAVASGAVEVDVAVGSGVSLGSGVAVLWGVVVSKAPQPPETVTLIVTVGVSTLPALSCALDLIW